MLLIWAGVASAGTWTVGSGGDFPTIGQAVQAASSGDVIEIAEGTYAESLALGDKTLTLRGAGDGTKIIGPGTGAALGMTNGRLESLFISNPGASGVYVYDAGDAVLDGVTVQDCGVSWSWGSGLYIGSGAMVEVLDSTFADNTGDRGAHIYSSATELRLEGSSFEDGSAATFGGVFSAAGALTISDTRFNGNEAVSGGAAIFAEGGPASISDSLFEDNGGTASYGAAIAMNGIDLSVVDSIFERNYSSEWDTASPYGGAIYVNGGGVTVSGSTFEGNAAGYGGAIYATGSAPVTSIDNTYTGNQAYQGAAVYSYYGGEVSDEASTWSGNSSSYEGTLYVYGSTSVNLGGSSFEGNFGYYGGALRIAYTTLNIWDAEFIENQGYYYGGAGYLSALYGATIMDSRFEGNWADYGYGGALYVYYYMDLDLDGTVFQDNEAGYNGGAIYLNAGVNLDVWGATFEDNTAGGVGGAIYDYGGDWSGAGYGMRFWDSTFIENEAGDAGGAITAYRVDRLEIRDSDFWENEATNVGYGGALEVMDSFGLDVHGSHFFANHAEYGGAAWVQGSWAGSSWTNNVFQENSAATGGAMVMVTEPESVVRNNDFVANRGIERAGVVGLSESAVDFRNNSVVDTVSGEAVVAFDDASRDTSRFEFNAWDSNLGGDVGGELSGGLTSSGGNIQVPPGFASFSGDGNPDNDSFALSPDSAMIDAGDPALSDWDGSLSDIGSTGGPDFNAWDDDGDSFYTDRDCDDSDPEVYPGASDDWYDGVDSDCGGGSDYDQDGDGEDSVDWGGEDCLDQDPAQIECPEDDKNPDKPGDPGDEECGCSSTPPSASLAGLLLLGLALTRRRR